MILGVACVRCFGLLVCGCFVLMLCLVFALCWCLLLCVCVLECLWLLLWLCFGVGNCVSVLFGFDAFGLLVLCLVAVLLCVVGCFECFAC